MEFNDIPPAYIEIAKQIGLKRTQLNAKARNSNVDFHSLNPEKADFIGVLGEILAAFELTKKAYGYTLSALLDDKPVQTADVFFDANNKRWCVDVKATETRLKRVPKRKLDKAEQSGINAYWFFRISLKENYYIHNFHSVEEVKQWNCAEQYGEEQYHKKFV